MVRGKHGFERIVWAFKEVLNHSISWLFYDLNGKNDGSSPIAQLQPKMRTVTPKYQTIAAAVVPDLAQDIGDNDYELSTEFLEWLTLAVMRSPRVKRNDKIDTYLSRYNVPGSIATSPESTTCVTQDLATFEWHGLIPATFIKAIFLAAMKASGGNWFSTNVAGFDGHAYTILQRKHHTMTWEYSD